MNKPKFYKGRPIIQPGEIYEIEGNEYKVITATSKIIEENTNGLMMTEPVFWLENINTNERWYIEKKELESKFVEK